MEQNKKESKFLKGNLGKLVISFAVSFVIWLLISVEMFPTQEARVRNIAINTPSTSYMNQNNLRIVSCSEDYVEIRIEGKRYDISGLTSEDFYASVNLDNVRSPGTFTLPVDVSLMLDDRDCTILKTEPHSVTLVVDEIVSREFVINGTAPDISLPEGYYADEITTSPEIITLTGSASVLDKVASVEARSTFSGEIRESHETTSEIIIYGTNGSRIINNEIKLSEEDVSVNIPIYKQKELGISFSFTNLPANFDVDSLKYTIYPETITVASPDDSIDYQNELILDPVDISDIKLNQTATIPIKLPNGWKNLSGNTSARITWEISDYSKMDYTVNTFAVTNQPDNFNVSLITNEMTLTVIGPAEKVKELTANDLLVTVNLLGVTLREGTQDVPVSITIRGSKQKCWVSGSYKATIFASAKTEQEE